MAVIPMEEAPSTSWHRPLQSLTGSVLMRVLTTQCLSLKKSAEPAPKTGMTVMPRRVVRRVVRAIVVGIMAVVLSRD